MTIFTIENNIVRPIQLSDRMFIYLDKDCTGGIVQLFDECIELPFFTDIEDAKKYANSSKKVKFVKVKPIR